MFRDSEQGVIVIRIFCFVLAGSILFAAGTAAAEPAMGQIAVVARAPDNANVDGVRLSILYGQNSSMSGLDLGFFSLSESEKMSGAAFVFGIHRLTGGMDGGAAFSLVNLHAGNDTGFNAAFVNMVDSAENALDLGFVNIASGTTMVDIAALNLSDESTAQLGFVNVTKHLTGFQLGFINVADNGFLKVFPFFNFPKSGN